MGCREGRWKMGPRGLEAQMTIPVGLVTYRNASGMKQACGRTQQDPTVVRRAGLGISLPSTRTKAAPQICWWKARVVPLQIMKLLWLGEGFYPAGVALRTCSTCLRQHHGQAGHQTSGTG